jgi:hypothetical protein
MGAIVKIGWGILVAGTLLLIFIHPAYDPVPTLTGKRLPLPVLLVYAILCVLICWRWTYFQTQALSRHIGDHQDVPAFHPDVTDLTCVRLR